LSTQEGDDSLENNTYTAAIMPAAGVMIPPPPQTCSGQFYTVERGNTVFNIARTFSVTEEALLEANPQIADKNVIYVGQVICIPAIPPSACNLRVLSLRFLTVTGEVLQFESGSVQLEGRVIVRATFNLPVSKAYFFIEPTGTETCELANLIGIDCPSAVTGVAEILWLVPAGTLGYVYVVACLENCCTKSQEVLVYRKN
jgi:LysM repeat protein